MTYLHTNKLKLHTIMKSIFLVYRAQYDNKGNLKSLETTDVFTSKRKAQSYVTWLNKEWDPFDNESPFYSISEQPINTIDYSKLTY